jgi:hypothetical protein
MAVKLERETRAAHNGQSLGSLFSELTRELSLLVRQEIDLAKAELTHKATTAGKDIGFVAGGALIAYAGFLTLVAMCVIILGQLGVPWWLSALIVGVVVTGIGGYLIYSGITQLRRLTPVPRQTVETVKEDVQWAKNQMS